MSRLDSFIRRLEAQRACLDFSARLLGDMPGAILEIGLGNGRTYDHLREIFPNREIYVFDRRIAAHPDCIPPASRMFLGDLPASLVAAHDRLGGHVAVLAHVDIGSGDEARSQQLARDLAPALMALMRPGGLILSDQPMPGCEDVAPPAGIQPRRYFIGRVASPR
ncbi:MAG TPA: class I SAM-dependent methyltransferase [Dongiaceae bacterium]|jgi:hypothetical protein|nr:class I SAM-dependent methyltransferase [Dongiaceae bacterium]